MNVTNSQLIEIVQNNGKEHRCNNCNQLFFVGIMADGAQAHKCHKCGSMNLIACFKADNKEVVKNTIVKNIVR